MADAPAMAAGMTGAEAPDGPGGAGAGGAAAEEQMMGPPLDEPGFPSLPMFKGELNEWINATTPQRLAMVSLGLREGLGLSGMGMLADDGNGMLQSGLTYGTRFGALKAEVVSQGVLQTTLEGFMPLPFLQLTTQLAFMPQGLAGGAMQSVLMSPIGAIIGSANLGGQLSAELLLPLQPFGEDSQLLLGANAWGLPGAWGGSKFAVEYTQAEPTADGSMPTRIGTVTAEVTRPRAGSPNGVSGSLSACQQLGGGDALNATFEVTPPPWPLPLAPLAPRPHPRPDSRPAPRGDPSRRAGAVDGREQAGGARSAAARPHRLQRPARARAADGEGGSPADCRRGGGHHPGGQAAQVWRHAHVQPLSRARPGRGLGRVAATASRNPGRGALKGPLAWATSPSHSTWNRITEYNNPLLTAKWGAA